MARPIWSNRLGRGGENWSPFSCSEDGCFVPLGALDERKPCNGRKKSSREKSEEKKDLGITLRRRNKLVPEKKRMNIEA